MFRAWQESCCEHQFEIPFSSFLSHVGKPFDCILEALSVPIELHDSMKKTYGRIASVNANQLSLYRNITLVLRRLRYAGYKIGIVTSKEYWRADLIVERFLLNCDLLVTPEHTTLGKPSPEPILYALEVLGESPAKSFYVGDMSSDRSAALSADVTFMKANWGYGSFLHSGISLDTPLELLELLQLC
jgi:HAD superfamily hydrolase (TIGR01549 family)